LFPLNWILTTRPRTNIEGTKGASRDAVQQMLNTK
jgi:hypothetical protein